MDSISNDMFSNKKKQNVYDNNGILFSNLSVNNNMLITADNSCLMDYMSRLIKSTTWLMRRKNQST